MTATIETRKAFYNNVRQIIKGAIEQMEELAYNEDRAGNITEEQEADLYQAIFELMNKAEFKAGMTARQIREA